MNVNFRGLGKFVFFLKKSPSEEFFQQTTIVESTYGFFGILEFISSPETAQAF